MMRKTHIKGGIIAGLVISYIGLESLPLVSDITLNKNISELILISGSIIGSVLPDIDHVNSYAGRKFWLFSRFLNLVSKISKKLKLKKMTKITGHRGFVHSILYWILSCGLLFFIPDFLLSKFSDMPMSELAISMYKVFLVGIFVGALSHILLDMMTVSGVPILIPLSFKNMKIPLYIKTNSKEEKVFSTFLTIVIVVVFLYIYGNINLIKIVTEKSLEIKEVFQEGNLLK